MRKLALTLVTVLLFVSLAVANTVTMKLVNLGPGSAGGPNTSSGVYVYPYYFSIDNSSTLIPLICDSYDNEIYVGETWTATVTTLSAGNGMLTSILASGVSTTDAYKEAAWLLSQLNGMPSSSTAAGINYAIWGLFSSNARNSSGYTSSGAAGWKTQADTFLATNPSSSFFDAFQIYTPVAGTQSRGGLPQEFIGYTPGTPHDPNTPTSPVPEPASLMLVGTGLLATATVVRRKMKI